MWKTKFILITLLILCPLFLVACKSESSQETTSVASPTTQEMLEITPEPLKARGLEGIVIPNLQLEVIQSYPQIEGEFSQPIAEIVERILQRINVQVVDEGEISDTKLVFDVNCEAYGDQYEQIGFCYSGAEVTGWVKLTTSTHSPFAATIYGVTGAGAIRVDQCAKTPRDARFTYALYFAILDGLNKLWGPQVFVAALWEEDPVIMVIVATMLEKTELEAKEATPSFIQGLAKAEKEQRTDISAFIAGILKKITGQDFGEDAAAWQQWFAAEE